MGNVLTVLLERVPDGLPDAAWELRAAAKALAGDGRIGVALLGHGVAEQAQALAMGFDDVWVFDDERLAAPDGVADGAALLGLIERERPFATLLAHTNVAIDTAPALSVKADVPLLPDLSALEAKGNGLEGVRAVYGGKVHARVTAGPSETGIMATIRGGAFAAAPPDGDAGGTVHAEAVPADLGVGRRAVRTVEPDPGDVDITGAELLVGVGRGIEDEENLEVVQALATAVGGELACSRPVVDKGWLPKSRQVGTSGVTVKPKLYLAVGISGSFQHLGGIKGSPYLVAINKDPRAPIFGVADVGIVGDLFEVVPALEAKIKETKG